MALPNVPQNSALLSGVTTRLFISKPDGQLTQASRVALTQEIDFTPTGEIQSVPLFGEIFTRAVKTGVGGTLNFKLLGKATDAIVKMVLDAGYAVDEAARLKFLVVNPDMHAYIGYITVETAKPLYDNRNVFGYEVSSTLDGQFIPFTFKEEDLTA